MMSDLTTGIFFFAGKKQKYALQSKIAPQTEMAQITLMFTPVKIQVLKSVTHLTILNY